MATLTEAPPPITTRRFSVEEYYRMADAGIISPNDRVELIDGEVVQMAAITSYHADCVDTLNVLFIETLGRSVIVRVQGPVRLSEHSEPEPDIALLRRPPGGSYRNAHPQPDDVLLIIEVSYSTVGYDRDVKAPMYAAAGIPELWLVNLERDFIDVLSDPVDGDYRTARRYVRGDRIAPTLLPDALLDVSEILG